jgi:hypothetical protein
MRFNLQLTEVTSHDRTANEKIRGLPQNRKCVTSSKETPIQLEISIEWTT